jgi:hypothetical protein
VVCAAGVSWDIQGVGGMNALIRCDVCGMRRVTKLSLPEYTQVGAGVNYPCPTEGMWTQHNVLEKFPEGTLLVLEESAV